MNDVRMLVASIVLGLVIWTALVLVVASLSRLVP
jgi:hypothetical protein